MKTLLTGRELRSESFGFDQDGEDFTSIGVNMDYLPEEERKLKAAREGWDLLFSARIE